jgi:hypothetical protein
MQGNFNVDWDSFLDDPGLDEETSRLYRKEADELEVAKRSTRVGRRRGRGRVRITDGLLRGRGKKTGKKTGKDKEGKKTEKTQKNLLNARDGSDDDDDDDGDDDGDDDDDEDDDDDGGSEPSPPPDRNTGRRRRRARHNSPPNKHPEPHMPSQRFELDNRTFFVIKGSAEPRPGLFGHYLRPYTIDDDDECVPYPPPDGYEPGYVKTWHQRFLPVGIPGLPWPSEDLVEYVNDAWTKHVENWIQPTHPGDDLRRIAGWSARQLGFFTDASMRCVRDHATSPFMIERETFRSNRRDHVLVHHTGPPGNPDPCLPPNIDYCVKDKDYVMCKSPIEDPDYFELGSDFLKRVVERGEALDFAFAQRMQGLLGVGQEAVWACLDPDFNPADRAGALDQFSAGLTSGFYKSVAWEDQHDARAVATEALQQHKAFCQVMACAMSAFMRE